MKQNTKLKNFDFAKEGYAEFEIDEVFALINLSRACMREINAVILSTIPEEVIVNYELPLFLENKKINGKKLDVRYRKFNAFLRDKYSKKFSCSDSIIRTYFNNVQNID